MSPRTRPAALGLALLLAALPAAAQQQPDLESVKARVASPVALALEELVPAAVRRGLPAQPFLDKALEGTAKRVPPPQIVQALRSLGEELGRAQALLQGAGSVTPRDISSVAVALRRGAPPDGVRRLSLGAGPGEEIGVTAQTLADLVQRGVDRRDAVDLLLTWRSQGADPESLKQIPAVVDRLIREGVIPAQAAEAIQGAIRAGRGPGTVTPPRGVKPPKGKPSGRP